VENVLQQQRQQHQQQQRLPEKGRKYVKSLYIEKSKTPKRKIIFYFIYQNDKKKEIYSRKVILCE
jgi:hypothetical protein